MAQCDQGYLCQVCGHEVDKITDSSLYLRFVIGEIDPEVLHLAPDSHLACTPTLSQFIDDERLSTTHAAPEMFARKHLDPAFAHTRACLVTKGYRRLWEIAKNRARFQAVRDYPLPEVIQKWQS